MCPFEVSTKIQGGCLLTFLLSSFWTGSTSTRRRTADASAGSGNASEVEDPTVRPLLDLALSSSNPPDSYFSLCILDQPATVAKTSRVGSECTTSPSLASASRRTSTRRTTRLSTGRICLEGMRLKSLSSLRALFSRFLVVCFCPFFSSWRVLRLRPSPGRHLSRKRTSLSIPRTRAIPSFPLLDGLLRNSLSTDLAASSAQSCDLVESVPLVLRILVVEPLLLRLHLCDKKVKTAKRCLSAW